VQYFPHPAWFFVPVLQFLKSVAGRNVIGPILVPVVLLAITFGIPFLSRKLASASLILIVLIVFGLSLSARQDRAVPEIRGRLQRQAFLAAEEAAKPFVPDQINSSVSRARDRLPPAPQQFAACAECHGDLGGGGMIGPDLINVGKNYNSPEQLEAVLLDPQGHGVAVGQMPRFTDDRMPAYERKALIEYLTSIPKN
jgi:mono/diheme cytochrome c family protein